MKYLIIFSFIFLNWGCDGKRSRPEGGLTNLGQTIDGGKNLTGDEKELAYQTCLALKEKSDNVNDVITQINLKYIQNLQDCSGNNFRNSLKVSIMSDLGMVAEGDTYEDFPKNEISHEFQFLKTICSKLIADKDGHVSNTDTLSKKSIVRREFQGSLSAGTATLVLKFGEQIQPKQFQVNKILSYNIELAKNNQFPKGMVKGFQVIKSCGDKSKVKQSLYSLTLNGTVR